MSLGPHLVRPTRCRNFWPEACTGDPGGDLVWLETGRLMPAVSREDCLQKRSFDKGNLIDLIGAVDCIAEECEFSEVEGYSML